MSLFGNEKDSLGWPRLSLYKFDLLWRIDGEGIEIPRRVLLILIS